METFTIKVNECSNNILAFEWTIQRKIFHYFAFMIPFSLGLLLFVIRFIFDPVITSPGFVLSIIGLILIIIGAIYLSAVTTKFQVQFHSQSLKLTIIKTQIQYFSRKYVRSYSGMGLEISKITFSLSKWTRFFPIKENRIIINKVKILENDFDLNWKTFVETIHKRLLLSKRLPNSNNK